MKNISQKIAGLQSKKDNLERELLELKQKTVQELSRALVHIQDIENVDTYTIIGAVLKSLKTDNETEDLQKAGRMFCRKYKHQINLLSTTKTRDQ